MLKSSEILMLFGVLTISSTPAYAQGSGHTVVVTMHSDTVTGWMFLYKKYDSVTVARNWLKLRKGMPLEDAMKLVGRPDSVCSYLSESPTYWWYGRRLLVFDDSSLTLSSEPFSTTVVNRNIDKVKTKMNEGSVLNLLGTPDRIGVDPVNALYYWWYGRHAVVITAIDKRVWQCIAISSASGG
jgi:hypothetical protein